MATRFRKAGAMRFTNPKQFKMFVELYSLDKTNEKGPLFVHETGASNSWKGSLLDAPPRKIFTAYCKVGDKPISATLSTAPELPNDDWKYATNKMIGWQTDNKKELFEFLKKQGVSEGQFKDLKTVKVQNLRELIDASTEEWREVTSREKVEQKLVHKLKTEKETLDVTIRASTNRSDALTFLVTKDYSAAFAKHESEMNVMLEKFVKFDVHAASED